ncbi:hypothetical protein ABZ863_14085 [Saccharomonospora sp. NPDC046836]|uniref:hypothetical protein n=1 Tax=Saccharomonospora sp. NPDC046836 TaxID=3156921 RepID=UPI0033ECCD7B
MVDTAAKPPTDRTAWQLTAQLGWLGVAGFVTGIPSAAVLFAPILLVPTLALLFALNYLVGTATAKATPLTAGPGRRAVWAGLVTVLGFAGVLYLLVLSPSGVLGGALFALPGPVVAAILADRWPVRAGGLALTGVAIVVGIINPDSMHMFGTLCLGLLGL